MQVTGTQINHVVFNEFMNTRYNKLQLLAWQTKYMQLMRELPLHSVRDF
jgi:hypothetical protein